MGVTVFRRTEKLRDLLDSINEQPIDAVYIADQGEMTEEKEQLYSRDFPFELNVYDLEFNIGTGYCRWLVANESQEDYLLIVDSDNTVPKNVGLLVNQLEKRQDLGGVSGILSEEGRIWSGAHDYRIKNNVLIQGTDSPKIIENIAGAPFVEFDFLPNITIFRRECLDDFAWDKDFPGYQHPDFYVGHFKNTEWTFGVNPQVVFPHHPGGSDSYMSYRSDVERLWKDKQMFLEKWDLDQIVVGNSTWLDSQFRPPRKSELIEQLVKSIIRDLPITIQARLVDLRDKIRIWQGKRPV